MHKSYVIGLLCGVALCCAGTAMASSDGAARGPKANDSNNKKICGENLKMSSARCDSITGAADVLPKNSTVTIAVTANRGSAECIFDLESPRGHMVVSTHLYQNQVEPRDMKCDAYTWCTTVQLAECKREIQAAGWSSVDSYLLSK